MKQIFVDGLLIGTTHVKLGYNCQDYRSTYVDPENNFSIFIVSDGCGSGKNSEFGSYYGSELLKNLIVKELKNQLCFNPKFEINDAFISAISYKFKQELEDISLLKQFKRSSYESLKEFVYDSLLFTIIGAIIVNETLYIFHLGDGYYAVNGTLIEITSPIKNTPEYFSYNLLSTVPTQPLYYEFILSEIIPLSEVEHFLLATDGLREFIRCEKYLIPMETESVGNLLDLYDDYYFKNETALQRKLNKINTPAVLLRRDNNGNIIKIDKNGGLITDDLAIILIRNFEDNES